MTPTVLPDDLAPALLEFLLLDARDSHLQMGLPTLPRSRWAQRSPCLLRGLRQNFLLVPERLGHSVGPSLRCWNATIPYEGTEFFGSYTQIEWQPCGPNYPIADSSLNARMCGLTISDGNLSAPELLGATYMLPFVLGTPLSWSFTYHDGSCAGYAQRAQPRRRGRSPTAAGRPGVVGEAAGRVRAAAIAAGRRVRAAGAPSNVVPGPGVRPQPPSGGARSPRSSVRR